MRYGSKMKRYNSTFGLLLLLLLPLNIEAQQVRMYCAQVDTAGAVTINWASVSIPVGYQYEIYASTSISGGYTLLATEPITSTSFTDTYANGGLTQWFYVVKAVPIPPTTGASYSSDTLANITFVFFNPGTGVAELYWWRPAIPPFSTQDKEFIIMRGEEGGTMQKWATTDTTLYFDTVHICCKVLDYQIVLHDSRGCDNFSIIRSDLMCDFIAPDTPHLGSVSINPISEKIELEWRRSTSSDTYGYIVLIFKNGIWLPIDTIFGAENTHYVDFNTDAAVRQRYRIATIDTCRNTSPMGEEQHTIFCNVKTQICDGKVVIKWDAYDNMLEGLTGYRIWVSEVGGSFSVVDTVPSNQLTYTHLGIDEFKDYIYYVEAYNINNGYAASSAKSVAKFNRRKEAGDVWLRYVSVVDNKDIEVAVYVRDTVNFNGLFLYRSDNGGTSFSQVATKTKSAGVESYFFTDTKVDVQTVTYLYTVDLTDVCNEPFATTDTVCNIVLKSVEALSDVNEMVWTAYYGFGVRLDGYDVYRQLQTETSMQLIDNLPASQTDYSENVWDMAAQGGKFMYQVSANEDNTNPYGFCDKSFSNAVEIGKSPKSYTPNSFTPNGDGLNEVFKPVLVYVDAKEYAFAIFDRWGNQIFYTNDITLGWDGTINGKSAAMGVYSYTLTYRLTPTKMHVEQGHVNLIR